MTEGGDPPCWAGLVDTSDPRRGDSPLGTATWASLVHGLSDAVVAADRDGTITYWNLAAEGLFGWSAVEAIGQPLDIIVPERHRARHDAGYARAVQSGTSRYRDQTLEVPALHRDGSRRSIAFSITMLTGADGTLERVVAVIRDDGARWSQRQAAAARPEDRAAPAAAGSGSQEG